MEVRAILRHTRTTPQKARLVANMIRGKNVNDAMNILAFLQKRVAGEFQKLLKSAIANAEVNQKIRIVLSGVPIGNPGFVVSQPKPIRMNFLTHVISPKPGFRLISR